MKLLVISDLHATNADATQGNGPSYVAFSSPRRNATSDPLVGLKHLLDVGKIPKPDVIICAGDLADKAESAAISGVWRELMALKNDHSIPFLVATCGNHDVDSRHKENKFDPKGFLRALSPSFPIPTFGKSDNPHLNYWANNFSILETDTWRVLNINSSAYHGFGEGTAPEREHGRISDYTLDDIECALDEISTNAPGKTNICLFHHHLRDISSDTFDDNSIMKGANRLLDLLSRAKFGEWFVIHGHRHRSSIYYAGGNAGPIVLSCASFSATRVTDVNNPCPNQFYVIDLDQELKSGFAKVKGRIQSWNWTPGQGWQSELSIPSGLPISAGFGFRGDLRTIADNIAAVVLPLGRATWDELHNRIDDLHFLIPTDLESLRGILDSRSDLVVSVDGSRIREIVRR
jgi:3',5'-cyclic AMP phosphodiesterase CpdA